MTFGLAATAADMSLAGAVPAAFEQVVSQGGRAAFMHLPYAVILPLSSLLSQGLLGGLGGAVGAALASKVGPSELPQTVAAFHSLGECYGMNNVT